MRLEYLRSFRLVGEMGSVTKAARQLWMSQPAVSLEIKRLESELGVKLFDRRRNRLVLNDDGRACLRFARQVEDLWDGLKQELRAAPKVSPVITIGSHPVTARVILPPILEEFHTHAPGTRIIVQDLSIAEIIDRIQRSKLDLGLMAKRHLRPNFEAEPVLSERLWIVSHAGHELAACPEVTAAQLSGVDFVSLEPNTESHDLLHQWANSLGVPLNVVMEVSSEDFLLEATLRGLGLALIGESTITQEVNAGRVKILPVQGMPLYRTMYVTFLSLSQLSDASRTLLEAMVERYMFTTATNGQAHVAAVTDGR